MIFRRAILLDFGTCSSEQQNWKEKNCQYIELLKFTTWILLKFYTCSYMFIGTQIKKQMFLPCFASFSLVGDLGDMMTSTAICLVSFSLMVKIFLFCF